MSIFIASRQRFFGRRKLIRLLFGLLADPEDAHRLRVRVRRSFHKIALDVSTEFVAEKESAT